LLLHNSKKERFLKKPIVSEK